MTERECPFCVIDPERTELIEETPLYKVILSNPAAMRGHLLVMPSRHVVAPWEMTEEERLIVYGSVLRYGQKIIESQLAPGYDIKQNFRPFIPQGNVKVDHVHFHVQPRFPNDEYDQAVGINERPLWKMISLEERKHFRDFYIS